MTNSKEEMLWLIRHNALQNIAVLTNQFIHAKPEEKEAIQAGIDFERWLAGTALECLG